MKGHSLQTVIEFKDKNTNEMLRCLILVNTNKMIERVKSTLDELTEKYCLPEQDILVVTH